MTCSHTPSITSIMSFNVIQKPFLNFDIPFIDEPPMVLPFVSLIGADRVVSSVELVSFSEFTGGRGEFNTKGDDNDDDARPIRKK